MTGGDFTFYVPGKVFKMNISTQVLREFYAVVTGKRYFKSPLEPKVANPGQYGILVPGKIFSPFHFFTLVESALLIFVGQFHLLIPGFCPCSDLLFQHDSSMRYTAAITKAIIIKRRKTSGVLFRGFAGACWILVVFSLNL
jgi:hypothetical protein